MGEVQWLDEMEMRLWRSFLEVSVGVQQRLDASLKSAAGLTLDDYEVLVHLSEAQDHQLRMSELSARLLHSQSRLTQRVNRLVDRGLVAREKCSEDGRVTFAVITDLGMATITDAAPGHLNDVRANLIDQVPADQLELFVDVLEAIADHGQFRG